MKKKMKSEISEKFEIEDEMKKKQCTRYGSCRAPLCPLDEEIGLTWTVVDQVCTREDAPLWVKKQREIYKEMKKILDLPFIKELLEDTDESSFSAEESVKSMINSYLKPGPNTWGTSWDLTAEELEELYS